MQLIKIKSYPIKYEMHIENAKLTTPAIDPAEFSMKTTPLKIESKTKDIQMRMDSSDMRRSMGMKTIADVAREAPAKTQQTANRVTSEYVSMGNQMANGASEGMTVAQLMRQKSFENTTIESTIAQIPSEKVDISWEPATIKHEVRPASVEMDWKKAAQEMEFVPSKLSLEVQEYAHVEIEYLGGFQYFPESSDPDYEAKE